MVCVKSDRLAVRLHIGIFIKNSGTGIVTDGRRAKRLAVSIMPQSVSIHIRSDIGHHFYDWEFLDRKPPWGIGRNQLRKPLLIYSVLLEGTPDSFESKIQEVLLIVGGELVHSVVNQGQGDTPVNDPATRKIARARSFP